MKRPIRIVVAAAALEELLDLLQALLGDLHALAVADEEGAAEPAAERVGRDGRPRRRTTHTIAISTNSEISPWPATTPPTITVVSPGRDQADERAGLQEREHADEQVGPRAERLPDVLDQLLEVGQRDRRRRRAEHQRRRHADRADEPACGAPSAGAGSDQQEPRRQRRPRRAASADFTGRVAPWRDRPAGHAGRAPGREPADASAARARRRLDADSREEADDGRARAGRPARWRGAGGPRTRSSAASIAGQQRRSAAASRSLTSAAAARRRAAAARDARRARPARGAAPSRSASR